MGNLRVSFYSDSEYVVYEKVERGIFDHEDDPDPEEIVFKGSISDCEAYIRLRKEGYL